MEFYLNSEKRTLHIFAFLLRDAFCATLNAISCCGIRNKKINFIYRKWKAMLTQILQNQLGNFIQNFYLKVQWFLFMNLSKRPRLVFNYQEKAFVIFRKKFFSSKLCCVCPCFIALALSIYSTLYIDLQSLYNYFSFKNIQGFRIRLLIFWHFNAEKTVHYSEIGFIILKLVWWNQWNKRNSAILPDSSKIVFFLSFLIFHSLFRKQCIQVLHSNVRENI